MRLGLVRCSRTVISASMLLAALAACGSKPPPDASVPAKAAESTAADAKPDMPVTTAPAEAGSAPAAPSIASAAPKSDEPEVSDKDPGDSGAFNLGAPHAKAVVEANKPFLNKSCWADAVKSNPSGPAKVKVAIEAEVTPEGKVTKVTIVGGKDYPGFTDCVKRHVMRWKWPRAKSVSSVMFPMEFAHGEVQWREKEKK